MADTKEALPVVAWAWGEGKVADIASEFMKQQMPGYFEPYDIPLVRQSDATAAIAELRAEVEWLRNELFKLGRMSDAPCFCCGYNGAGYFQPASHPCATKHHKLFHGDDDEGDGAECD